MQVLHFAILTVVSYAAVLTLQLLDRRRFSPEVRERMWNYATWGSAVYAFGPLSLLGWFWVTRFRFDPRLARWFPPKARGRVPGAHAFYRGALGLGLGVLAIALVQLVVLLVELVLVEGLGFREIG